MTRPVQAITLLFLSSLAKNVKASQKDIVLLASIKFVLHPAVGGVRPLRNHPRGNTDPLIILLQLFFSFRFL